MKSIILFHTEFYFSGGAEHTLLETIDFLEKNGYRVKAYAPFVNYDTCFPDRINKSKVLPLLPAWITAIPLPRELYIIIAAGIAPLLLFQFRSADIFYGANQAGPYFAYVASRIHRKPYGIYMPYPQGFLYPRKIDYEFGLHQDQNSIAKIIIKCLKSLFKKIDHKIVAGASFVITEGVYAQQLFENIYKRQIINCPAGADPLTDTEATQIDRFTKPYILVTNRHMPKKKFEYAIEMLRIIREKYHGTPQLIITGESTDYTQTVKQKINEYNLNNQVKFTGYIPEDQAIELYKHATVYIYTAPEEDYGKGIIIAMANNIPVVAWDNAGPSKIIKEGISGFLIPLNEIATFADKVYELCTNEQLNKKLGDNARHEVIQNFSKTSHDQKVLQCINQSATSSK